MLTCSCLRDERHERLGGCQVCPYTTARQERLTKSAGRNIPLATSHLGRCTRTSFCEKPQSHSGFCSGPRDKKPSSSSGPNCLDSSISLRKSGSSVQSVQTFPLTTNDMAQGQARVQSSDLEGWEDWSAETIIAKVPKSVCLTRRQQSSPALEIKCRLQFFRWYSQLSIISGLLLTTTLFFSSQSVLAFVTATDRLKMKIA